MSTQDLQKRGLVLSGDGVKCVLSVCSVILFMLKKLSSLCICKRALFTVVGLIFKILLYINYNFMPIPLMFRVESERKIK